MARLHFVKKAQKKNRVAEIGESYYWWKFAYGPKQYSKKKPLRSQLTQSAFLSSIYDIEDNLLEDYTEDDAQELVAQLEELRDQCQESYDNMPETLQDSSDSGQTLQERIDGLEEWISEIQTIAWEETTPEEAAEIIEAANPGTW